MLLSCFTSALTAVALQEGDLTRGQGRGQKSPQVLNRRGRREGLETGQLERGTKHLAAQGCKEGYKYNINRSLPIYMSEWCEMPHTRGICCITVTREACGDALN